eukprot:4309966-Pyramimonas_sp.AAC.1
MRATSLPTEQLSTLAMCACPGGTSSAASAKATPHATPRTASRPGIGRQLSKEILHPGIGSGGLDKGEVPFKG